MQFITVIMKPIFLVGYMGSGKTTLGRALGKKLGIEFIDLDIYIEGRYMRTVRNIFEEYGEKKFREIERNMLHEVAEMNDVVVACGGGTPCFFDNMDYMNERGMTVCLHASIDRLAERLGRKRHKRPLIMNLNDEQLRRFIIENLDKRKPFYDKAHHRFCGEELEDTRQISETVENFITTFNII